jgi:rare lipoprotein A
MLRRSRPAQVGAGALVVAIPASAVALTVGQADAQSAIQIDAQPRRVAFARVARTATDGASPIAPSAAAPVSVRSRFVVPRRSIDVLAGQSAHVRGQLLPALAGRRIRLLGRSGRSWRTLATARTGGRGGFDLRYRAGDMGQRWLRVRFTGDRLNSGSWAHARRLTVFRESVASWYTDGGGTACGFHAFYGVANRTLPCGTKVTFRSGGRSVTAVVDDRGPFVGGREWDLNQNTAGALGFGGVGAVWSSI